MFNPVLLLPDLARDMRMKDAAQSVEWGLLAQMSAEEVRCA